MARAVLHAPRFSAPAVAVGSRRRRLRAPSALMVNWIGMAMLFATVAISLYLSQMSLVATAGRELERLDVERKGWVARNERLDLELAKRRSLRWVESQAVQRLEMVHAGKPAPVIVVVDGR